MSKRKKNDDDGMLPEYDFSKGIRGKYVGRAPSLSRLARLDQDVAKVFADDKSVNDALRALAKILRDHGRRAKE
jgi:hypothetical protein